MHEELFDLCHIQHTGLPETDDPMPMFVILRPALAAGKVRQQALIARVTGGMVASPN
jgi:hypothetical protein